MATGEGAARFLELAEDWLATGFRRGAARGGPAEPFGEGGGELFGAAETLSEQVPLADSLELVAREAAACRRCRLGAGRKSSVPGAGCERPLVLVIGEGPGAEEDARGLPFVGPAGKLLDKMLESIGLSRAENCFIANVVKCRPPANRTPEPDEVAACVPYLERQVRLLAPRAVLALGRTAIHALTGSTDKGIGALRGRELDFRGTPLMATYHPSALLHDETLKRPAWEDLKAFRRMLDSLGG